MKQADRWAAGAGLALTGAVALGALLARDTSAAPPALLSSVTTHLQSDSSVYAVIELADRPERPPVGLPRRVLHTEPFGRLYVIEADLDADTLVVTHANRAQKVLLGVPKSRVIGQDGLILPVPAAGGVLRDVLAEAATGFQKTRFVEANPPWLPVGAGQPGATWYSVDFPYPWDAAVDIFLSVGTTDGSLGAVDVYRAGTATRLPLSPERAGYAVFKEVSWDVALDPERLNESIPKEVPLPESVQRWERVAGAGPRPLPYHVERQRIRLDFQGLFVSNGGSLPSFGRPEGPASADDLTGPFFRTGAPDAVHRVLEYPCRGNGNGRARSASRMRWIIEGGGQEVLMAGAELKLTVDGALDAPGMDGCAHLSVGVGRRGAGSAVATLITQESWEVCRGGYKRTVVLPLSAGEVVGDLLVEVDAVFEAACRGSSEGLMTYVVSLASEQQPVVCVAGCSVP